MEKARVGEGVATKKNSSVKDWRLDRAWPLESHQGPLHLLPPKIHPSFLLP